ncbi:MAG TPA: hypothetical protein VHD90_00230 [Phototrophicaceae bacterium]|nr:hypothetical protein [Phototrophicaceae bacterium]
MSTDQAIQAQQLHQHTLLAKANVVGVGVGFKTNKGSTNGDLSVVVLVQQKKPLAALTAQDVIPPELEGMKTDVMEVGYLRAQQAALPDPKGRVRPIIPPGVSIGHYKVTAGTFGALVTDKVSGQKLILSNNHVLANSNGAAIGDAILQPGAIDGGQNPGDMVATLERFIKLTYTDDSVVTSPPPAQPPTNPPPAPTPTNPTTPTTPGTTSSVCDILELIISVLNAFASASGSQKRVQSTTVTPQAVSSGIITPAPASTTPAAQADVPTNTVDCALAKPVDPAMFTDEILQIGKVSGTKVATLGMRVRKFGRTTSYTEGNVTLLNATVNIAYDTAAGQKTARFVGTVVTEAMSDGGDSGSLIVDAASPAAVGLLFAGSSQATIFLPIDAVLNQLNVTI